MKGSLRSKSKDFSIKIIKLFKWLTDRNEHVMSKQLLRSGTSVGANIRESEYAVSRKDFLNKLTIALKECNESAYWLELLYETNYIEQQEYNELYNMCLEILRMLKSSTRTLKERVEDNE